MEMPHNPIVKPLKLDEHIVNPTRFIKATLKKLDELIIYLVIDS
jgi:hypothetical protein